MDGTKETFKLIRSSKRTPVEATLGGNREEAFSKEKERTLTDRWICRTRSSKKERRVDALALRAEERRDKLRKATGRSKYP